MKNIVTIICILTVQMVFSQNQIDSLDYYYKNQNFIKAIEYGQKKIKNLESKNLKYTPECSITYGSLGDIYRETKDFKLAEISYLNEIEIITKVVGFDSSSLGTSYWCLANIYNDMKDYEKAEENYIIAIKIKRKVLGEKNLEYENYLIDLAIYYGWRNEDKKAVDLFKYICELRKINYGFESLEYNKTLLSFAIYYFSKNDFSNYDLIIQSILKFCQKNDLKTENVKNRKDAQFIFQIALMLERQNDIFNADLFFKKTLELQPKFLNKKDFYDSDVLFYSGLFYFKINRIKEATKLFCDYIETSKFLIKNKIIIFTNLEQNDFKNDFFIKRFQITSILNLFPTQYPEINISCYENELLVKNLSLRNQQRIAKSIQKSGDSNLQEKYKHFINNKKQLAAINNLSIAQCPTDYDQLSTTTETLEKELTRLSSNFADAKNSLAINWKQIQDKLQPNEIAIDLVSFQYYNKKWTDSIVYSAFVVGKNFKAPKYIPLFEQKQLEFLLYRNQNQTDNKKFDNQYTDKSISDLFHKPLQNELNGVSTIYLSPSGLGHQINFSALPVSENQTLGEKYKLHVLGSTTEIIDYKMASLDKKNNLELLLYGNIDYNKTDVSNLNNKDTIAVNQDFVAQTRNVANETAMHPFLPGSKIEINKIYEIAKENSFNAKIIEDRKATEESIKALDGRTTPFVLHLATHGFFFPYLKIKIPKNDIPDENIKKSFYTQAEDPMLRSGLIFAGADKFWGKPAENSTSEDGILTASEIANLDLSACQLVVMSACDTGLGDINGSEGVFGLQRAFKMAGVKNIIMSLWKVDDAKTVEFFQIFYTNCLTNKSIHDAFLNTQSAMKAKYPPYFWAGFVLLE